MPHLPSAVPVPSPRRGRACATIAGAVLAVLAAGARAQPADDEAFYQRAATCAAALEVDQLALVARARAGEPDLRPRIVHLTQAGFAYVGTAYKRGLRDPRADEMLKAARAEQKGWDAARHAKVAAECLAEGDALYQGASSIEQWLVTNKVNKRVDRFLNSSKPPAHAPAAPASESAASR
jgi:hypothetical protein